MSKIIITYKDYIHCNIKGLNSFDMTNLIKKFEVFIPSARYTPMYKLGRWNGKIQYFQMSGNTYVNLIPEILDIINLNNYDGVEHIYKDGLPSEPNIEEIIDETYMSDITWYKGHRLEGQPIILEEHQVNGVNALLSSPRGILSACTSAGKTLMCGALCKKIKDFGKTVLIVPGKDLCLQTANELKYFGHDVGIVGMGLREFGHNITVCTWQTINSLEKRKNDEYLTFEELQKLTEDVICLIFDECHTCKGNEIKKVAEQTFKNVPIRWGLTGTVPKEKSDYMSLITSLGKPVETVIKAKDLQEKNFLSDCKINCIQMNDDKKFLDWTDESNYLSNDTDRLNFISSLVSNIVQTSNNTLVLVNHISTGEELERLIKKNNVDVIFLNGSVKSKKRFEEYESIKTTNNKCIIATAQIASTGLNIPRLFNLVLMDIGKSFTRCIQSIGRGLRKAQDKNTVTIYDISSTTKYSKKHLNERIKYYNEAQYPFTVFNIDKWK